MIKTEDYRHRHKQPSSEINQARKLLKKYNFITTKKLARLMRIAGQRASRILVALPEWNKYGARSWAREGYPL